MLMNSVAVVCGHCRCTALKELGNSGPWELSTSVAMVGGCWWSSVAEGSECGKYAAVKALSSGGPVGIAGARCRGQRVL